MMRMLYLIIVIGLVGCANSPQSNNQLELFFSAEQITLTAEQRRKIVQFFDTYSYNNITVIVGPAKLNNKFEALLHSQKRMQNIESIAHERQIPLTLEYSPNITANTLLLRSN
ncbi:hypothetical protein E5A76_13295 [Photobacterium sp. CAIM 1937]|nr:hypothetical protein VT25_05305 [Photobacterium leiognathi subsp. mandapamensis]MBP2699736.1 hypothetical protein [Vibrio parahaemolyticus]MZG57410.1 hypothetical protein [Photobacterium lucens]MZG79887.1 hypothetical protein [Photobacterium lucens]